MIKDQSPFDKRTSPNTNITDQLYEEFIVLKDYLDSSKKKKKQTMTTKHKNQQQDHQQNHSKLGEQQNTNQQQRYLKQPKNDHHMIINTPKPTNKWRKFISKIQSNNSHDQQQQMHTNSPEQTSEYKNQQALNHLINFQQSHEKIKQNKPFNLNFNQPKKRSQLIAQYTQLYQYSIKKVIENNNRRIKKKRKHNQDQQQHQTIKNTFLNNLQKQIETQDKNKVKKSQNIVKEKDNNQIARKLVFNFKDSDQNDDQQFIQQQSIERTNIFVQQLMIPFQSSISRIVDSHSQRLKQIDQNLGKIKLFMHDNNQKQTKSIEMKKSSNQQHEEKVSKWKKNFMQVESQQNQINKQKDKVQTLQFNQFNEEYVPDDTSSLYSQTIQGRDLQFDQQT